MGESIRSSYFSIDDLYDKVEEEEEQLTSSGIHLVDNPLNNPLLFPPSKDALAATSDAAKPPPTPPPTPSRKDQSSHNLLGAGNRNRFLHSLEYSAALETLTAWSDPLDLHEVPAVNVRHPEYLTCRHMSATEGQETVTIKIRLPGEGVEEVRSMSVSSLFRKEHTPQAIVDYAAVKFFALGLDVSMVNVILKVVGQADFFLHRHAPLGWFDSITRASRMSEPLEVVLHNLDDEEHAALCGIIEQSVEDQWECFYEKYPQDEIDLYSPYADSPEDPAPTQASSISSSSPPHPSSARGTVTSSSSFSSSCPSPSPFPATSPARDDDPAPTSELCRDLCDSQFQIKLLSVRLLPSLDVSSLDALQCEISLCFNGKNILHEPLRSPPQQLPNARPASSAAWADASRKVPFNQNFNFSASVASASDERSSSLSSKIDSFTGRRPSMRPSSASSAPAPANADTTVALNFVIDTRIALSALPAGTRVVCRLVGIGAGLLGPQEVVLAGASTMLFRY